MMSFLEVSPIIEDGIFLGVVGVNVSLSNLQKDIIKLNNNNINEITLISNNGEIIANSSGIGIDRNIHHFIADSLQNIVERIAKRKSFSFNLPDSITNDLYFYSVVPFTIGKSTSPWAIILKVNEKNYLKETRSHTYITLLLCLSGLIILAVIIIFVANTIINPIKKANILLNNLATGNLSAGNNLNIKAKDEIGEMASSANTLFDNLKRTSGFANEIGKGNLSTEFNLLNKNDELGKALIEMQQSLKHAEEERLKRNEEEKIKRWMTSGIAKFGEILRNNNDIKSLSSQLISELLTYVDAIQGSLFLINDHDKDEIFYELTASIAFDRDKLLEKRFLLGEGLVGRCAQEQKTIILENTPEHFIEITSGLEQKSPTNFIIVPLNINNDVFGVIELVSFSPFKKHYIEFVEKIGENIAITLNNLKINNRTLELLEQSQQQGEELLAQEEEMRQNMEEMQTTQEETKKKEFEIKGTISAINNIAYVTEFDLDKTLIYIKRHWNITRTGSGQNN